MSAFVGDYCSESSHKTHVCFFHTRLFLKSVKHAYIHSYICQIYTLKETDMRTNIQHSKAEDEVISFKYFILFFYNAST